MAETINTNPCAHCQIPKWQYHIEDYRECPNSPLDDECNERREYLTSTKLDSATISIKKAYEALGDAMMRLEQIDEQRIANGLCQEALRTGDES